MKQHAENPINNSTYKADLDHDQRALASKLIKILKKMLFKNKTEVENSLTNANIANEYKKYLIKIFDNFHYQRTINNYSLINFHLNQEQANVNDYTYLLEKKTKNFGNGNDIKFSNLEWKIEVTLSSIWMKKVILIVFKLFEFLLFLGIKTYNSDGLDYKRWLEKIFLYRCFNVSRAEKKYCVNFEKYPSNRAKSLKI